MKLKNLIILVIVIVVLLYLADMAYQHGGIIPLLAKYLSK